MLTILVAGKTILLIIMTKDELQKYFEIWYNQNAAPQTAAFNKTEVQMIGVNELYINDAIGINRSFHQYILDANVSRDKLPKLLLYSRIDLLKIDSNGDIIAVIPIDYQILSSDIFAA